MKYVFKYVHTKFEGCLNSFEIGNFIYVIILHHLVLSNRVIMLLNEYLMKTKGYESKNIPS